MFSNRLTVAALGVACVAAAAGGGYLANRQNATSAAAPAVARSSSETAPGSYDVRHAEAVQETEGIVAEAMPSKPAAPRRDSSTRPAPSRAARPAAVAPAVASTNRPINWPSPNVSGSPSTPDPVQAAPPVVEPTAARDEDVRPPEPVRPPDPPARTFEELVVSADSVLGLQMETAVNTERARVEDRVEARVVRDVKVGGAVAIPAGSRAIGSVMVVERGGRLKERARLGIRFHTLVLADGTRLPITTETVFRLGEAPSNSSAAKIGGGAAAGAILGAIIGGAKGAAIGGTVGAGAGTTAVMSGERNSAGFPVGTDVTARFLAPVTVTVEK